MFLILLVSASLNAQDEDVGMKVRLQGFVFDAETTKPLGGANITVNKRFSGTSDNSGAFAVYASVRDTVGFSLLGYSPAYIVISDSMTVVQYMAGIFLKTDTIEIAEVVIIPRNSTLKSDILYAPAKTSREQGNARYNVSVAGYQGRTTTGKLGDPSTNYELLRQKQRTDAYEKGGIPSDRIVGLSPFMLVPAAMMLIHGLPERPPAYKPDVSEYELDLILKKYLEDHR